jgi:uncharacterized protein
MSSNHPGKLQRLLLILAGLLATALAIAGIFLPLLPTVPLLLLAAACFGRSSARLQRWLLEHPRLGPLVNDYLDGEGIPRQAKIKAVALLWLSIVLSALFLTEGLWLRLLLVVIGAGVTGYLLRLPTRQAPDNSPPPRIPGKEQST